MTICCLLLRALLCYSMHLSPPPLCVCVSECVCACVIVCVRLSVILSLPLSLSPSLSLCVWGYCLPGGVIRACVYCVCVSACYGCCLSLIVPWTRVATRTKIPSGSSCCPWEKGWYLHPPLPQYRDTSLVQSASALQGRISETHYNAANKGPHLGIAIHWLCR